MKSEQFVAEVASLAPSETELIDYGLDSDEISEIRSLFLFKKKSNSVEESTVTAVSFFREYDTDQREVGGISFLNEIVKEGNQMIFAQLEVDLFFQDVDSKKVYLRNEKNDVLNFVSSDFEHFLDIAYWSTFYKKNRKKEGFSIEELRHEMISKLIKTSGKESNKEFLSILFR